MGLIVCGDMIYFKDKKYNFVEYFNEQNGFLIRSNILENQRETDIVPTMRSAPELIDVGIMGHCISSKYGICAASGVDCYQNAPSRQQPNMSYEHYLEILQQCSGKTFQIALGGAGDPNKHKDFERILIATRKYRVIPNLTTSGFQITDHEIALMKQYCGAVAVSYYSKLDENGLESNPSTIAAINALISAGCITNIHYVLSKETVKEAIKRLEEGLFPSGIHAIIFLLYKPVGLGDVTKMLTAEDSEYIELIRLIGDGACRYKVGFDSCQSPALHRFSSKIASESIEYCDATRFSMYVDCNLVAYPCSFGYDQERFAVDLKSVSIEDAWHSKQFELFRHLQNKKCGDCHSVQCRDCALEIGVDVCGKIWPKGTAI